MKLSEVDVAELFDYSENSPSGLLWNCNRFAGKRKTIQKTVIGRVAGSKNKAGYWYVSVGDTGRYLVHRLIWILHNGVIPEDMVIDHIDQNKSNNNITNLRLVTTKINNRNTKIRITNKTGYTGVCKSGDNYIASWSEGSKTKCKKFSINKYGEAEAFELAKNFRHNKMIELNKLGEGYAENHGK